MVVRRYRKLSERAMLYRQLGMMLASGLTFANSLKLVDAKSFPSMTVDLANLQDSIGKGDSLLEACERNGQIFDQFPFERLDSGLDSVVLGKVFMSAADQVEGMADMRSRLSRVFWYPLVTMSLTLLVLVLLCTFVLPSFEAIYTDFGGRLPALTGFIFTFGRLVSSYFGVILAFGCIGLWLLFRRNGLAPKIAPRLPLFGCLVLKVRVYFFTRNVQSLLLSGLSLRDAVDFSCHLISHGPLGLDLAKQLPELSTPQELQALLAGTGQFPGMILGMIGASGRREGLAPLQEVLQHTVDYLGTDVDRTQYRVLLTAEVLSMIFIALLVGSSAAGMYLPIFKLAGAIGG